MNSNFELTIDDELRLVSVVETDARELFELVDSNREYLRKWLPWLDFNQTVDDSLKFLSNSRKEAESGSGLVLFIKLKDRIAGVIGFNWISDLHRSCELGYWIAQDLQGQGIVTRSARELLRYAFRDLKLNRVEMGIATTNHQSLSVAERLSFTIEGTKREAEWLYDHYVDHKMYALLKSEFEQSGD